MQNLKEMMTRVNNRVSKSAAENTRDLWLAVGRADMSVSGKVTLEAKDYGMIHKYAEACARKAGILP